MKVWVNNYWGIVVSFEIRIANNLLGLLTSPPKFSSPNMRGGLSV